MANRFLNAPVGEGGGVSISQLNTWFATKDTDDLAQGLLNLYVSPAEKAIIASLSTATTAPTPNTIAKRDNSGSSSFYNISAVGLYLRPDGVAIEPSINFVDTAGSDGYSIYTDTNGNVPNMYIYNSNNSGLLHLHSKTNLVIETSKGGDTKTFLFNYSGNFIVPHNITASGLITCNRSIINFSGNSVSANQSLADLNLINTNPAGNTKSAGIKFWMTDNIGQQKNLGHIYVRSDNDNVVEGDLVLANSIIDYEANPTLTCKSDGRVYVRGLTSSGTLVSSSGLITTDISCITITTTDLSSLNVIVRDAYLDRLEYPNLVSNEWVFNNGAQKETTFINLSGYDWAFRNGTELDTSGSVRINQNGLRTKALNSASLTAGSFLGTGNMFVNELQYEKRNDIDFIIYNAHPKNTQLRNMSGYNVRFINSTDAFNLSGHTNINNRGIQTIQLETTDVLATNILATGIVATNLSATNILATNNISGLNIGATQVYTGLVAPSVGSLSLQSSSGYNMTLFTPSGYDIQFRDLTGGAGGHLQIRNNGLRTTGTISGGIVNTSGLLASKATILGSNGSVQSIVGISTDTINTNAYTSDTLYMTTNLTTASGFSLGTGNQHRFSLLTNNTERVRITGNSGFVGINQATPSQALDVNGTIISSQLNISGSGNSWRYEVLGNKTNGSTYTLPSGRWTGEIHLQYGNDSGEVGIKKYAFYKAPGATGNGITTQQIYFYRSATSAESGITFDQNTGVFTFNLSGTNPSTSASIWYRSGT